MKIKYTTLVLSFTLFLCATAIGIAQTTIYSNNFEFGNGGWTDGGGNGDCEFRSNDSNSPQGNASWRIKDNSGNSSAFWQDFDFSAYDEVTISFSFKSVGFDNDGIDTFDNMSEKGVFVVDRVVQELIRGGIDLEKDVWYIPVK